MLGEIVELQALLRNRRLSLDKLRQLQESRLLRVVRHAFENVPFYRDL